MSGRYASAVFVAGWLAISMMMSADASSSPDRLILAQADTPSYKPPLRGAPGGRVGGASRGDPAGAALPTIELLAPDGHSGLTARATPTLYYYISRPVNLPIRVTISAPGQPRPLIETSLPPPSAPGISGIRLSNLRVQLQIGVNYTWSVSVVVDPRAPSSDVVATATLMRAASDPALEATLLNAPPTRRAALYAQAGFWYDAVDAAVEGENTDRHAALDNLLDQAGLTGPADFDRRAARGAIR